MFGHAPHTDGRRSSAPRASHGGAAAATLAANTNRPDATPALTPAPAGATGATAARAPARRWFSAGVVAALVLAVTLAFTGCGPASGCGARAFSAAMTQLGKPYVRGGAGPNAYDCSGLVQWSFARAGRLLPRTATAQYYAVAHIPTSALRPGDLVFFGSPGYLYHVAIYAGGGRIVAAPHTGTVVQIERLWTWNVYAGRA